MTRASRQFWNQLILTCLAGFLVTSQSARLFADSKIINLTPGSYLKGSSKEPVWFQDPGGLEVTLPLQWSEVSSHEIKPHPLKLRTVLLPRTAMLKTFDDWHSRQVVPFAPVPIVGSKKWRSTVTGELWAHHPQTMTWRQSESGVLNLRLRAQADEEDCQVYTQSEGRESQILSASSRVDSAEVLRGKSQIRVSTSRLFWLPTVAEKTTLIHFAGACVAKLGWLPSSAVPDHVWEAIQKEFHPTKQVSASHWEQLLHAGAPLPAWTRASLRQSLAQHTTWTRLRPEGASTSKAVELKSLIDLNPNRRRVVGTKVYELCPKKKLRFEALPSTLQLQVLSTSKNAKLTMTDSAGNKRRFRPSAEAKEALQTHYTGLIRVPQPVAYWDLQSDACTQVSLLQQDWRDEGVDYATVRRLSLEEEFRASLRKQLLKQSPIKHPALIELNAAWQRRQKQRLQQTAHIQASRTAKQFLSDWHELMEVGASYSAQMLAYKTVLQGGPVATKARDVLHRWQTSHDRPDPWLWSFPLPGHPVRKQLRELSYALAQDNQPRQAALVAATLPYSESRCFLETLFQELSWAPMQKEPSGCSESMLVWSHADEMVQQSLGTAKLLHPSGNESSWHVATPNQPLQIQASSLIKLELRSRLPNGAAHTFARLSVTSNKTSLAWPLVSAPSLESEFSDKETASGFRPGSLRKFYIRPESDRQIFTIAPDSGQLLVKVFRQGSSGLAQRWQFYEGWKTPPSLQKRLTQIGSLMQTHREKSLRLGQYLFERAEAGTDGLAHLGQYFRDHSAWVPVRQFINPMGSAVDQVATYLPDDRRTRLLRKLQGVANPSTEEIVLGRGETMQLQLDETTDRNVLIRSRPLALNFPDNPIRIQKSGTQLDVGRSFRIGSFETVEIYNPKESPSVALKVVSADENLSLNTTLKAPQKVWHRILPGKTLQIPVTGPQLYRVNYHPSSGGRQKYYLANSFLRISPIYKNRETWVRLYRWQGQAPMTLPPAPIPTNTLRVASRGEISEVILKDHSTTKSFGNKFVTVSTRCRIDQNCELGTQAQLSRKVESLPLWFGADASWLGKEHISEQKWRVRTTWQPKPWDLNLAVIGQQLQENNYASTTTGTASVGLTTHLTPNLEYRNALGGRKKSDSTGQFTFSSELRHYKWLRHRSRLRLFLEDKLGEKTWYSSFSHDWLFRPNWIYFIGASRTGDVSDALFAMRRTTLASGVETHLTSYKNLWTLRLEGQLITGDEKPTITAALSWEWDYRRGMSHRWPKSRKFAALNDFSSQVEGL